MDCGIEVHLPRRRRRAAYFLLRPLFLKEERSLLVGVVFVADLSKIPEFLEG